LTDRERAYVVARARVLDVAEAVGLAGISRTTYYKWSKKRRAYLDGLARDYKCNAAARAIEILEENAEEAARVKTKGLKSRRENIQQAAASDILDRILGKAMQRVKQDIKADVVTTLEWPDEGGIAPTTQDPEDSA